MSNDPRIVERAPRATVRTRFAHLTESFYDPFADDGELKYWISHQVNDKETGELIGVEPPDDDLVMVKCGLKDNVSRVVETPFGPVTGAMAMLFMKGLLSQLLAERIAQDTQP